MPDQSAQRGQAIVLIALMLAVLIGMAALAIDGARAYGHRRDLQAAVDSAALAAADKYQQTGNYSTAEQAAITVFGANSRLYAVPSCSAFMAPGPAPATVTCTYPDGTVLTQTVSFLGAQGSSFAMNATRPLALQFARVLTSGTTLTVGATATGSINNLVHQPAVGALSPAGCGGVGGNALTISGGGALKVTGDVVSNGSISISGATLKTAGDIYARCQGAVAGATSLCYPSGASTPCTYPDVAGAQRSGFRLADPNHPPPAVGGGSEPRPGHDVVLSPGTYPADPAINSDCYFLSPGVYSFPAGYTSTGGFLSNELKPPDEPNVNNNQLLANPQFWNTNGVNCAGSFQINISGSGGPSAGTWGVELTSVRIDWYAGVAHVRESAPSRCQQFNVQLFQSAQLQVSNVPGAQAYNIYLSSNACAGPFGLVFALPVQGNVSNQNTSGCPFVDVNRCTLGLESITVPVLALPFLPLPNLFAPPDAPGAYPPSGETAPLAPGLPNQNPQRAAPPAGDRANENQCDTTVGALATCPSGVTPGAISVTIPSGGCLNETNTADNYLFSGYQYNWIAIYEPGPAYAPANTCANRIGGASNSAAVGLIYLPAATVTVSSGAAFESVTTGGLIASQVTFSASPALNFSANYAPAPSAGRLSG